MKDEKPNAWLKERNVGEVECIVPDLAGVARGKIMPAQKFCSENGMRLPESLFIQTITGEYPKYVDTISPTDSDMILRPDVSTLRMLPWASKRTAQVIHDAFHKDGRPVESSPRYILRRVLKLYEDAGWKPVVAPELEFYLVRPNTDEDYPLEPPIGRSGRAEIGRQPFSIDAINEFGALFESVHDYCEAQGLEIDTLIHESGAAQMEINLQHGDPLALADQAFLFKRTMREAALRHDMYATFMAKPMENEPGSAMHVHQSVVDTGTGKNIFSTKKGEPTDLFFAHIAGLQKYLPATMAVLAPYVNSYRRVIRHNSAPINVQWGYDNRSAGLRIPHSGPDARRVENRVASADANPYLAIAASLACGYLGMRDMLEPTEPVVGSAYDMPFDLPRSLLHSIDLFRSCEPLIEILGSRFVQSYCAVKECEFDTYMRVVSSWERGYLLLNV